MRNRRVRVSGLKFCALLFAALLGCASQASAQKMKAEDVVAKHLEALGKAELRAPTRTRAAGGAITVLLRNSGGGGRPEGQALIASEGPKLLWATEFRQADYPFERMGFDGKKVTVRQYRPGQRTAFGEFVLSHEVLFKEGLIGGALTSAWPLLNLAERGAKLNYDGMSKVQGRDAHKLSYKPKKGSDLKIKMYFDAETFRHVRTDYERVVAATMGGAPGTSAGRVDTRYRLIEEFGDFKDEKGLMLPHAYSLEYMVTSEVGPVLLDWKFVLDTFTFEQPIDPEMFNTEK
jgi:hypothetical protein